MKHKYEDILRLYIGCQCDVQKKPGRIGFDNGIQVLQGFLVDMYPSCIESIKLHLRQLSDQNEEEKLVQDTAIGESSEDTFVEFKEERYKLTSRGFNFVKEKLIPTAPKELLKIIQDLKSKFAKLPLSSLLRYVYSNYPEYAQNSKLTYLLSS